MKYKSSLFKSSVLSDTVISIRNIADRYENIIKNKTLSIDEIRKIILEDLCKKYCEEILNTITNKRFLNTLQSYTIKVIGILNRDYIPINKESNYLSKEVASVFNKIFIYVPMGVTKNEYIRSLGTYSILHFIYMIEIEMIEKDKPDVLRKWRIIPYTLEYNIFKFDVRGEWNFYKNILKIQNDNEILNALKNFKMNIEDICTELNFYDESLNLNPLFKIVNGKIEIYR